MKNDNIIIKNLPYNNPCKDKMKANTWKRCGNCTHINWSTHTDEFCSKWTKNEAT